MLDQNINRIKFHRSEIAGRRPAAIDLADGELALNLKDRTIFSKDSAGNIIDLGFGKGGNVDGPINATGNITSPRFIGQVTGNADTASKWAVARKITVSGDAVGEVTLDGSGNVILPLQVDTVFPRADVLKKADTAPSQRRGLSIDWVQPDAGFPSYGTIVTAKSYGPGGGTLQVYTPYSPQFGGKSLQYRTSVATTGTPWTELKTIVDNENIGGYAPSLTGVGATGEWNINSATATKLKAPQLINDTAFDGTQAITLNDPTFARPLVHASMHVNNTNNVAESGGVQFRFAPVGASNRPIGVTDGPLMSMAYDSLWNFQLFGDHRTGTLYTRPKNTGNWGTWKTTLNNENIGQHALPITGGTVQGNLTVRDWISSPVISATNGYVIIENRTIKPTQLTAKSFNVYFVGKDGLNTGAPGVQWGDFITLNGWDEQSGGTKNGLFVDKTTKRISHYQAEYGATTWGTPSEIAYLTDTIDAAKKLATPRLINEVLFDGTTDIKTGIADRGTIVNETQLDAAKLDGKYLVNNFAISGMYGYGILVVTTHGGSISQTYYAHQPAGPNASTQATRQSWNNGTDWSIWNLLGSLDSTKLPLAGGTITGSLQVNGNIDCLSQVKGRELFAKGDVPLNPAVSGSYISWNISDNAGKTDFVNHKGTGGGGFDWWSGVKDNWTKLMTLSPVNNGTVFVNRLEGTASNADKWKTARNITIGKVNKFIDGSADATYTLAEMGAVDKEGDTISGDLKVQGNIVDKFGLVDKMHWTGAISRPGENVLVTPVNANTFTANILLPAGSRFIDFGTSQLHLITQASWADPNPTILTGTIVSSVNNDGSHQNITLTCTKNNHGITVPTYYFWTALTYQAYGCSYDGWVAGGGLRYSPKFKSDILFKTKAPIATVSHTASTWYTATTSGTGRPEPSVEAGAMVVLSTTPVTNQHIALVGGGYVVVSYISLSVKDKA